MSVLHVDAPAKVNLFLGVGARRQDGYHEVRTVLQAISLADELTVAASEVLTFSCTPDLGIPAEQNLAYRAVHALSSVLSRPAAAAVRLRKEIPPGAGLGGGSSDAAGVLIALAELWGIQRDDARVQRVAAGLGADVAFFLGEGGGTALMGSRGDRLERALPTPQLDLVLVRPPAPVSTANAYAAFDSAPSAPADPGALLAALAAGEPEAIAAALANNLADAACSLVPAVGDALAWVRRSEGVLGATVSGSGSAVFGICRSRSEAQRVAEAAGLRGMWSRATTTRDRGVSVRTEPRQQ